MPSLNFSFNKYYLHRPWLGYLLIVLLFALLAYSVWWFFSLKIEAVDEQLENLVTSTTFYFPSYTR
ncbi:hypothetical protein [Telluribacter sp.]|jgi:sulfite exporter TauE/SafE|uniref:hypothetical protein n=1 Tax=Telluribacter sp. TaxID=1978767 RepID=UPI002E0DBE10|nr:hypothetical protein [Telluribacter sp.]